MANDQQFCLRWNNHQTTLVEIFDKLLSNERLVDCTLAAEGQYLRAHKVLLSACSPYFELILSQHNDKHPIIILKDVTFRELKALMDYMYRGEVNVSQDQLGALLKVAENLQIKGLSDSGGGGTEPKEKPPEKRPLPPPPPAQQPTPIIPRPGLTIEHRRSNQLDLSQHSPSALDGSPVPRKRKRTRRRSSDDESSLGHTPIESHHDSSSRESSSLSIPPNVASTPLSKSAAVIPEPPPVLDRTDHILPEPAQSIHQEIVHKTEPNTEMLLEPKHEYPDDDMNEDSVEDLTLEDDMNDLDQSQAGPSGEGSSSQGSLGQLYSLIKRHVPPLVPPFIPPYYFPETFLYPRSPRPTRACDLTSATIDSLLHSLAGDVAFRKYDVQNVLLALEAVLKGGCTISLASTTYGINRSTLNFYLKKLNIATRRKPLLK